MHTILGWTLSGSLEQLHGSGSSQCVFLHHLNRLGVAAGNPSLRVSLGREALTRMVNPVLHGAKKGHVRS